MFVSNKLLPSNDCMFVRGSYARWPPRRVTVPKNDLKFKDYVITIVS